MLYYLHSHYAIAVECTEKQTFIIPEHRRSVLHSSLPGSDVGVLQDVTPCVIRVKDLLIKCFDKDGPKGGCSSECLVIL